MASPALLLVLRWAPADRSRARRTRGKAPDSPEELRRREREVLRHRGREVLRRREREELRRREREELCHRGREELARCWDRESAGDLCR
jgi:hypothetical protein